MNSKYNNSGKYIEILESNAVLYSLALLTLTFVGRIHELFPFFWDLSPIKISFVVAILSILFSSYPKNKLSAVLTGIPGRYLVVIFIIAFFSIWGGVWPSASVTYFKELGYRMLYFILVTVSLTSLRGIRFLLKVIVLMYVVLVIAALIAPVYVNGRAHVTVCYDPNDFALLLTMCLPVVFCCLVENNKMLKGVLTIVLFVSGLVVIISTGSRGGILALLTGVFFFFRKYGSLRLVVPVLVICSMSFYFASTSDHPQFERLKTIYDLGSDYNIASKQGRVEIWKRGVGIIADNPFLGTGIGNYLVAEGAVKESGRWMTAHNSYIQLGVELGIFALIVFITMLFKSFSILDRIKKQSSELFHIANGIQGTVAVYCVGSIFLSWAYTFPLYLFLGLVAVMDFLYEKHRDDDGYVNVSQDKPIQCQS